MIKKETILKVVTEKNNVAFEVKVTADGVEIDTVHGCRLGEAAGLLKMLAEELENVYR